jgi:hypothetical protein
MRTADGRFLFFGNEPEMQIDQVEGRFGHFLAPEIPGEATRKEARQRLRERGIHGSLDKERGRERGREMVED